MASYVFGVSQISYMVKSRVNGYTSFLVSPDGSKEGWAESEEGDNRRATFIEWLRSKRYEDGSSPYSWAEVLYGDDDQQAAIVAHDADGHV
jgi:hypothetical protein